MKIILKQDVAKVGRKHQVVEVNDGFARNFLLKQGKAVPATANNLSQLEEVDKLNRQSQERLLTDLTRLQELVKTEPLVVALKANAEGQLFAGLRQKDIVTAVKGQFGIDLEPKMIRLDQPIKQIGEHQVTLILPQKETLFTVTIKSLD